MCSVCRIREIIRRLKLYYGDDTPKQIIEARNVVLCYLDEDCVSRGAYEQFEDIQYIYINTKLCDFERRMTYAHELGHSILHPDVDTFELKKSSTYFLDKYEKEAKIFASEFLLSDEVLKKLKYCTVFELAKEECVSVELVQLKISNACKYNSYAI